MSGSPRGIARLQRRILGPNQRRAARMPRAPDSWFCHRNNALSRPVAENSAAASPRSATSASSSVCTNLPRWRGPRADSTSAGWPPSAGRRRTRGSARGTGAETRRDMHVRARSNRAAHGALRQSRRPRAARFPSPCRCPLRSPRKWCQPPRRQRAVPAVRTMADANRSESGRRETRARAWSPGEDEPLAGTSGRKSRKTDAAVPGRRLQRTARHRH